MKKAVQTGVTLTRVLLIALWVYAAFSKWVDFDRFAAQMHKQALFPLLQASIIYLLPPAELVTAGLLAYVPTRAAGYWASLLLLAAFTAYIALGKLHAFGRVPCSCGGILEHMGWTAHLLFNTFFLALTTTTIIIQRKEDRWTLN